MHEAMPAGAAQPPRAEAESSRGKPAIRSAPERFFETWLDALGGFLFSVVLPIPFYATGEPFAKGIGATEQTILSTAVAYVIVWYCGRRLDAFPRATLQGNVGYVAPVAAIAYAAIAVLLLLLRSDYSRVQLFGSGLLTIVWMAFVAQLRARYLIRDYAVVPSSLLPQMPETSACRWLTYEEVEAAGLRVDAMIADLGPDLTEAQVSALAAAAIAGVPVLDRRYIVETMTGRTPLGGLTPNEFGALLPSRQYLVIRRGLELLLTVLVLPILLPVIAVVALLVRLDSSGPIFFLQNRVGRRGRVFRMVKFRTMHHNAGGPSFTTTGDKRVTRIGGVLRRYRLDEVPQLVNVLRGDMSWVGPRPEALTLDEEYVRDIPHFALRGIVRPGVTGWAQINQGYAHEAEEMRHKLEYDLYYLKHCSLWLDVMIVLRTFAVLLGGAGAR
ncbi:MAG: sugar transferase [Proteobacteria bacterium]|nr:sugar transferase [Pseudomonadota bacterium]